MEAKRDGRRDVVMTDVEALVPKDHLLRKIEAVIRRGLARVSAWVRLKFAAFNLKKLARWWALYSFAPPAFRIYSPRFSPFPLAGKGFFDRQSRLRRLNDGRPIGSFD